jgi:hypothetical protein
MITSYDFITIHRNFMDVKLNVMKLMKCKSVIQLLRQQP